MPSTTTIPNGIRSISPKTAKSFKLILIVIDLTPYNDNTRLQPLPDERGEM
jgi:hypothetical protein